MKIPYRTETKTSKQTRKQANKKLTFKARRTKTLPQRMSTKITAKRLIFTIFSVVKMFAGPAAAVELSVDGDAVIDSMRALVLAFTCCDGSKC